MISSRSPGISEAEVIIQLGVNQPGTLLTTCSTSQRKGASADYSTISVIVLIQICQRDVSVKAYYCVYFCKYHVYRLHLG